MTTQLYAGTFAAELSRLLAGQAAEQHHIKGATVFVLPDREQMGRAAGLLALYHLTQQYSPSAIWSFARAPSQVATWHTIAERWPHGFSGETITMVPFDEIRGSKYQALEQQELRARLPEGVLPNKIEINPGDLSRKHAGAEALRLNAAVLSLDFHNVFKFATAGLSPNAPLEAISRSEFNPDDYECHLAFDREGLPLVEDAFKAIPMSRAASAQQQRESVVNSAAEIDSDHVVTMTAWYLATQTQAIVFSLPDDRGINLWRVLNQNPETSKVPATLMQRHRYLGKKSADMIPYVSFVTTRQSWIQYEAAQQHFVSTGKVLGAQGSTR